MLYFSYNFILNVNNKVQTLMVCSLKTKAPGQKLMPNLNSACSIYKETALKTLASNYVLGCVIVQAMYLYIINVRT